MYCMEQVRGTGELARQAKSRGVAIIANQTTGGRTMEGETESEEARLTVYQFFPAGAFLRDYEAPMTVVGHEHIAIWEDRIYPRKEWELHPGEMNPSWLHNGTEIPVSLPRTSEGYLLRNLAGRRVHRWALETCCSLHDEMMHDSDAETGDAAENASISWPPDSFSEAALALSRQTDHVSGTRSVRNPASNHPRFNGAALATASLGQIRSRVRFQSTALIFLNLCMPSARLPIYVK